MADRGWVVWRDYTDRAPGWGHVITLPSSHGFVLMAFLSTIVTIAGGSAWKMISLLIHAHFARQGPTSDVFGLQQQVSLRNPGSAFRAAVDAFMIHWSWSKVPGRGRLRRTSMVAIPGAFIWTAFTIASIMISKIATEADDTVTVRTIPNRCGLMMFKRDDEGIHAFMAQEEYDDNVYDKWTNDTIQARNYALSVQPNSGPSGKQGSIFYNPKLDYTPRTLSECMLPNNTYCLVADNYAPTTISFTSAKLSSHDDLGINAPPQDRVYFQLNTTCSVLAPMFRTTLDDKYTWDIGPVGMAEDGTPTFEYLFGKWYEKVGYQIDAAYAPAGVEGHLRWRPIPGIARDDADMGYIILTQNGVTYARPVKDPWFAAATELGTRYEGDRWANIMVCAEQYRWCTSANDEGQCTDWGGSLHLQKGAIEKDGVLGYNVAQRATAIRLSWDPLNLPSIVDSAVNLGTAALYASKKIRYNRQSTWLDSTQWQKEVSGWFESALADWQALTYEYVHKSSNLDAFKVYSPETDAKELSAGWDYMTPEVLAILADQCKNQLSTDPGNLQNFSMGGVIIVIVVSAVLVLLSSWFTELLDLISDLRLKYSHRPQKVGAEPVSTSPTKIARQADDRLHLLRYALDGASFAHDGTAKYWSEVSFTGVPVLRPLEDSEELAKKDLTVERPVMMTENDDLSEYPKNTYQQEMRTLLPSKRSTFFRQSQEVPYYQPDPPTRQSSGTMVSIYQARDGAHPNFPSSPPTRDSSGDLGTVIESENSNLLQSPGYPHYEPSPPLGHAADGWMSPEGDLGRSPNAEQTIYFIPK